MWSYDVKCSQTQGSRIRCLILILAVSVNLWTELVAIDSSVPDTDVLSEPNMKSEQDDEVWCQPEQIHISCGDSPSQMTVMWSALGHCDTHVTYSDEPWNMSLKVDGQAVEMKSKQNGSLIFSHRAVLKNLSPSCNYFFRIVTTSGFGTKPIYFKTLPAKNSTSKVTFLVSNDLSPSSDKASISKIVGEVSSGSVTGFMYSGDLESKLAAPEDGKRDSMFLSTIEQIAAYHPFMIVPAKKQKVDTEPVSSHYLYRHMFSMPNTAWPMPEDKMWYSFDAGLVHFISYSTEVLMSYNTSLSRAQQDWLVQDLTVANKRRPQTPWIVAFGNDPMYCACGNPDTDDCARNSSVIKHGLEDMFYVFGVDLIVESAHRCYERSWPKYKGVRTNLEDSYNQPRAPVEVILGLQHQGESLESASTNNSVATESSGWSALHLDKLEGGTYGRLNVINSTHLKWELLSASHVEPLDAFVIVQETHGNFNLANLPHNVSHQINQTIIAQGGKPGTYDFIRNVTGDGNILNSEGWSPYSVWLGLGAVAVVLTVVLGMVAVRSCVRRRRRHRRWRDDDSRDGAAGGFYSVGSGSDSEDENDFEIDVYDKANKQSSKLLTSY